MSRDKELKDEGASEKETKRAPVKRAKPRIFRDLAGVPLFAGKTGKTSLKDYNVDKFDADVLTHWYGQQQVTIPGKTEKHPGTEALVVEFDPDNPMPPHRLKPGPDSPVCAKCALNLTGCIAPYLPYLGAKKPIVTIILEGVTRGDDDRKMIATNGNADALKRIIADSAEVTGVNLEDVRWVTVTKCANRGPKMLNLKSRGNWCRYHVVDELMKNTPSMVIPVGTTVLGLLSHKSNAQEWSGRLLTYRGWPDDWLTNPKYALPRPDPRDPSKTVVGHPVFGSVPDWRIPMVPLQVPGLVYKDRNDILTKRYRDSFIRALKMAKEGVEALSYTRTWYDFSDDPDHVEMRLKELARLKGIKVTYDTETSGLRPWETRWTREGDDMACKIGSARIVSMMFRWNDPVTGEPKSLGFPWETKVWRIYDVRNRLRPLVWKILTQSILIGHNITFDMLFSWATLNRKYTQLDKAGWDDPALNRERDARICALADACRYDTWHMAFAYQQKRGSLGLEAMAYDWVPDLAGYEEDFTLLIDLHREKMHPGEGKGGHYLNLEDKSKTDTHLVPYVMGDVEVAHKAFERIHEKLKHAKVYEIPIADPKRPGEFRWFTTRDRNWIYENIMSPASRVLMKMMARGIYIDQDELKKQVDKMPAEIKSLRDELAQVDERIVDYVSEMKALEGAEWELDLENKGQLKELLFNRLELPVLRLTKAGKAKFGENVDEVKAKFKSAALKSAPELANNPHQLSRYVEKMLHEYAAVDKFTLNKLTVQLEKLRPLRKYRKAFKLYSTYIRPLQNVMTSLDKRARKNDPHLCFDSCVHASFLLTGTRGGRLSCKDPNLQQLPRDGEVKSLFVSRFGERGCIYQGDLSQIELRLLAAASGDPTMVKAYFDDVDLHTLTASRIFSMPYEQFSKDHMKKLQEKGQDDKAKELDTMRNIAKTVNFLTGYGGGAFGLQNVLAMRDIDKPIEECEQIIELFFNSYPAIRKLLRYYKKFIEDNAVAVSIFGRVRVFEEVHGEDNEAASKALRSGCNHLIQSTASDMMLTALFCIEALMREANLESILVSTVHDSLLIDCVKEELPQVHDIVTMVLNNFPEVFKNVYGEDFDTSWLIVPFSGDCEVGTDYLHVKKIGANPDWDELVRDMGSK